jgi:hypothetical protein
VHRDIKLHATPLVQQIQVALNISLVELSQRQSISLSVVPLFGKPASNLDIGNLDIFVLMPFAANLKPVYDDHLKSVAKAMELKIARGDDFFSASAIISDIWSAINNAKLCIADRTGRNPNVFYEVGMAHTIGKPVILLTQSMDDVPFDLRYIRCIQYDFTPRGMAALEDSLKRSIASELGKHDSQHALNLDKE